MRSGTNLPRVRDYNQGVILEAIRAEEGISRVELALKTGLTKQTVSVIVKRLLDQKLIQEDGVRVSSGGKRATKLRVESRAYYAIGVLFEGDYFNLVAMALDGQIIAESQHTTSAEPEPRQVIRQVANSIKELIRSSELDVSKILGVGVGCLGPLDYRKGIVYSPPILKGWDEVPFKQLLEAEIGYPVTVDNEATAAAIGERWSGGAQGVNNFAFISMNTGIGAGLYIENQIYRGSTTYAGEFGHITLDPYGPACFCGNRGCVEACCAPVAVVKAVHARLSQNEASSLLACFKEAPAKVNFEAISKAALSGDSLADEEIKRAAWLLGCGLVSLVNLLDVELVVLGGKNFRQVGPLYREIIQQVLDERVIARARREIRVELSAVGENAGAVGAASLILDALFAPRLASLHSA